MARVMNPALRVALILQAVAAGIAGVQAIFLRFDRPTAEAARAIPRALGEIIEKGCKNIRYAESPDVLAASSRRAEQRGK
jgi:hypothetical protein